MIYSPRYLYSIYPMVWSAAVLWLSFPVAAQALRDPTVPPVEAGLHPSSTAQEPANSVENDGMVVVLRDGKPHLMQGSRLITVGSVVDGKRLEKITETEIWFRDGKQRIKVPRFLPEIQIRRSAPTVKPASP